MLKIADNPGLRRDPFTNAVLDVDQEGYAKYRALKNAKKEQTERVNAMESRINNMEADLADIKNLLIRLVEK